MPRKKWSPLSGSPDEGYSEEIQSDSSLESNSRRNARRKKPQRKDSSKENRINLLLQLTNKNEEEQPQENSSEKSGKRPRIIKIFRRIDRKAKNIYLVDDKIEDRNELVRPPEPKCYLNIYNKVESLRSIDLSNGERSPSSNFTEQRSTTFKEHSTGTIKTNRRERDDFEEVNAWNMPSDSSYSSAADSDQIYNKNGVLNRPSDSSYSSAADTDQIYNKIDYWNMPSDIDALYPSVTDIDQIYNKIDYWNMPSDIDALYPSVTDIDQTPSRSDVYSPFLSTDSETSNSSKAGNDQTSTAANVCIQQSSSDLDFSVSDSDEIPTESDSSEKSTAVDVYLQQSSNDFDASVTGGDEISNESIYSRLLLSSYFDDSNLSTDADHVLSKAEDEAL